MAPEYIHFLVTRSPDISEIELATIIAYSSKHSINANRESVRMDEFLISKGERLTLIFTFALFLESVVNRKTK